MEYPIYCCFPHTRGKFTNRTERCKTLCGFPPYAGEVYLGGCPKFAVGAVSPIRGGSLLRQVPHHAVERGFPHTRGKFT